MTYSQMMKIIEEKDKRIQKLYERLLQMSRIHVVIIEILNVSAVLFISIGGALLGNGGYISWIGTICLVVGVIFTLISLVVLALLSSKKK